LLYHRDDHYYEALCDHQLVGFFTMAKDAQTLEIGLGLRPDLCGKGLGCDFLKQIETYLQKQCHPHVFMLSVATFNQRAVKVYQACGYEIIDTVTQASNGSIYEFYRMKKEV